MNASMNRQARRASLSMMVAAASVLVGSGKLELPLINYEQSSGQSGNQRTRRLRARRALSHPAARKKARHG